MDIKIVIIDDNINPINPLMIKLKEKFGDDNTLLFKKSKEGLDYILDHISEKIILLLDWDLGVGEIQGLEIFKRLKAKTSLISTIFITAKDIASIPREELLILINEDAFYFLDRTSNLEERFKIVEKSAHILETRLDCVLEAWVLKHSEPEREKPYLMTRTGEKYNLNDILIEIRKQSDFGKDLERKILNLTIDLLARQKEQL
jgi:DNA-binding NtrC family response regulator